MRGVAAGALTALGLQPTMTGAEAFTRFMTFRTERFRRPCEQLLLRVTMNRVTGQTSIAHRCVLHFSMEAGVAVTAETHLLFWLPEQTTVVGAVGVVASRAGLELGVANRALEPQLVT